MFPFGEQLPLQPTTRPWSLMSSATLQPPCSVPRSVILPSAHRTACSARVLFPPLIVSVQLEPTIWPASLIALAELSRYVPRVPRSVIFPCDHMTACSGETTTSLIGPVPLEPTIWPTLLMSLAVES